ncbi:MAG: M48 family metalloprotease [Phycisphaerae bacterium]|nr:M48 family metalloprotease [Phycisphaerae bacterium]
MGPLPYQESLASFLSSQEKDAWNWLSRDLTTAKHAERVRLDLLKATYRIDRQSKPEMYQLADSVRERLDITAPVTFYQTQQSADGGMNAALLYMPGEAHVVFSGPLLERLQDTELKALLGHELGHFGLLEGWYHRFRIAGELLGAMLHDPSAQPVHQESYRLYHLYGEIFCDRCSLCACGDLHAVIGMLVKVETGISDVSAESYLRQTEEICAGGQARTGGLSHPECYIRAAALRLWAQQGAEAEDRIRQMIEGPPSLDGMDVLSQRQIMSLTRRLIETLLCERWMRSDLVMAHARLFFEDLQPMDGQAPADAISEIARVEDEKLAKYLCYVLLDFAVCDRELEEPSLAAGLLLSRRLGLEKRFRDIATKELKLRKKQFDKLEAEAEAIVAAARRSEGAP